MAKVVRVTDVPDEVHAELRSRAEAAGQTLTAYLRERLTRLASEPEAAPEPVPAPQRPSEGASSVMDRMRAAGVTKKRDVPRY